jgi:hypothetical protein
MSLSLIYTLMHASLFVSVLLVDVVSSLHF